MNNKIKDLIIFDDDEDYSLLLKPEISIRGRKKINRIFREFFGSSRIPHPEVDNAYERTRSKFVRKINILKHKYGIDK